MTREMADVVRDDDARLGAAALGREIPRDVAMQADDGAQQGEVVEQVAADVGVLRGPNSR
jgi:hypothetical protein